MLEKYLKAVVVMLDPALEIIKELKIKEKQKVTVRRSGKKIIIEDWNCLHLTCDYI